MIKTGLRTIEGSDFPGENPLPMFRSRVHDTAMDDQYLLEEEKAGFGYETGNRFLPYKWQDGFVRGRSDKEIKTIVMENDYVRAEFWPDFGMRLHSLIQKKDGKELLFRNPVLQFGNLAVLRAWFSGGIEWNFGQYGHTVTTCAPLFCAKVRTADGREFLRAYEYERQRGIFWQLDFHLDDDDRNLWLYARFVNPNDSKRPFYWWTNIAVEEEDGMRIFSGTDKVIYMRSSSLETEDAPKVMVHGRLPYLDIKQGVDYTHPESFAEYSNEYFFQNRHREDESWEAAVWKDGWVFFDRADAALAYHKMFCWGGTAGGRHWRDYLSREGEGNYVELQGGFARTQVHGMDIEAGSTLDFVQTFGGFQAQPHLADCDYSEGRKLLYSQMEMLVSEEEVRARKILYASLADLEPGTLIHYGSGFGALEALREPSLVPSGLIFPPEAIKGDSAIWLDVLEGRPIDDVEIPPSYMVDLRWKNLLEAIADDNVTVWNLLGVMYLENEIDDEAKRCFDKALAIRRNAFSLRCLAIMAKQSGDLERAIALMKECTDLENRREYASEYIALLCEKEDWSGAMAYWKGLPEEVRTNETVLMTMIAPACALLAEDFLEELFSHEFALIREGARSFSESWFVLQTIKLAKVRGVPYSPALLEECRKTCTIPLKFDFRMG